MLGKDIPMSMLLLPKGVPICAEKAWELVTNYLENFPAVVDLYDRMSEGPHDEMTATDLLSVNALNGFPCIPGFPMSPMTALWLRRDEVNKLVAPISKKPL